jgi:hypothetical protein
MEAYEDEARKDYVLQAYNAWQIIEVIKLIASENAKPLSFADYIKKLGLQSKKEESRSNITKEAQIKSALSTADQIRQLDKQQGRD